MYTETLSQAAPHTLSRLLFQLLLIYYLLLLLLPFRRQNHLEVLISPLVAAPIPGRSALQLKPPSLLRLPNLSIP